jgi:hypothetical protein
MNTQSKILLRSVICQLVLSLELLNKTPEDDFRELGKIAKTKKTSIKYACRKLLTITAVIFAGTHKIYVCSTTRFLVSDHKEDILNQ